MDFFGLFLGIFGRLLLGTEVAAPPSSSEPSGWLKDSAMPDPNG